MPVEIETRPIFLYNVSLPLSETFFPLGFPVVVVTNSEAVLNAARKNWGMFQSVYAEKPLTLYLTVTEDEDGGMPDRPKFRSHDHVMSIVADAENHVTCNFNEGCARGWVTRRVAENTQYLRLHFLESSVMIMMVQAHLAPIHGALLTRNGVGIALCGESFAGKSTLAYACARSGWTYVTDDGTFLIRNHEGRYGVGNPQRVRLREDAKSLFPELENHRVIQKLNGEHALEVATAELPVVTANGCSIDHMVFLRRSRSAAARLTRLEGADALDWLERIPFYGSAEVEASQRQAYRRLIGAGTWELHYSDLSEAIDLLSELEASE